MLSPKKAELEQQVLFRTTMTIIFHEDGMESDATPRYAEQYPFWRRKAQGNAHQDSDYIDMEFGKSLDRPSHPTLANHNGITLTDNYLSSAMMATFVSQTKDCSKLLGYNAITQCQATPDRFLGRSKSLRFGRCSTASIFGTAQAARR